MPEAQELKPLEALRGKLAIAKRARTNQLTMMRYPYDSRWAKREKRIADLEARIALMEKAKCE